MTPSTASSWTTMTARVSQSEPMTRAGAEAFVYDHLRTPRGKGKAVGALHEVKPIDLIVGVLDELKARNPGLDPGRVDDIVLGVVSPLGEQGGDIAKTAALASGFPETVAGVQLNRFCASGLEAVNQAAARVRSGFEDLILAGGVESMSRVPMGSDGGAWAADPATALTTGFVPQGIGADLIATLEGWSRTDVDAYAAESHHRAAKAWANGYFSEAVVPVARPQRGRRARARRARPSRHERRGAGRPQAVVRGPRPRRGLRRRGPGEVPLGRADRPRPPRRQLLGHRRRRRASWPSAPRRSAPSSA